MLCIHTLFNGQWRMKVKLQNFYFISLIIFSLKVLFWHTLSCINGVFAFIRNIQCWENENAKMPQARKSCSSCYNIFADDDFHLKYDHIVEYF